MTNPELDRRNYDDIDALVRRVGRIFGYGGLAIEVKPGEGWYTEASPGFIKLVVDPEMLSPKDLKDAAGKTLDHPTTIPNEHYMMYGTCHELGHVEDFLDPIMSSDKLQSMSASDGFFWNVLDDAVINRRLTNIPLLNTITSRIYEEILFPDDEYTSLPKHVQFMYGLLLNSVTPGRNMAFSQDVMDALDILDGLQNGQKPYELYDVMADPRTGLSERREIAEQYVKPIYESFLEEDSQQQASQSQQVQAYSSDSGEQGQPESWQESYDAYRQVSPCGQHDSKDGNSPSGHSHEQTNNEDPHQAIKEAGETLRQQREDRQKIQAILPDGQSSRPGGSGAGNLAGELQLSSEDASRYQGAIDTYRAQIHQVSSIFQKLAVPTIEYTSPRYRHRATTEGAHLSPRDLFRVAVAQYSKQDPAIWRTVETVSKKEGLSFSGLDVHLVIDASGSMRGTKAESAASCFVMLAEGLEAACRAVKRYDQSAPHPDVRLQVILFGGSAKVIVPIGKDIDPSKKGQAFSTILSADGNSTYVAGALRVTKQCAADEPERTQLVYIITDGDFSDTATASQVAKEGSDNYHIAQYILDSPNTTPIANNFAHIANARELPFYLEKQLERLAQEFHT